MICGPEPGVFDVETRCGGGDVHVHEGGDAGGVDGCAVWFGGTFGGG